MDATGSKKMEKQIVTEMQKRTVACPTCGVGKGKPCRSSRQPGAHTFGGGWGGPPDLERAHAERRQAYLIDNAVAPRVRALPYYQINPIGLPFAVHEHPAHLIRNFRGPGHPDELTLCGEGSPFGSTTLLGYLDGGEFDCAGNPMPVCPACIEALRRFPRAPIPGDSGRYDAQRGEFIRHPHFPA
jgi:hypothetical protein